MQVAVKADRFTIPKRPDFEVLRDRLRAMAPAFAARAAETERNGRVPASSMTLLREGEIFKLLRPAAFGGFEYGAAELVEVGYEIGRACGSTGWCGTLTTFYPMVLAYYPEETQREIFAEGEPAFAVSYLPSKACEAVDGGYRISGSWAYASNADNADYFMLAALVPQAEGAPLLAWFIVPASAVTIDHDSWKTTGLQGTGSKVVKLDKPTFVPAQRAIFYKDVSAATVPGQKVAGNLMAMFPFSIVGPTALTSPILGMAQGALDAFIESGKSRLRSARPGVALQVANNPQVQTRIGWASATIESAKALLKASLRAAEAKLRAGERLSADDRIAIRRNQAFAAKQSVLVVNELFAKEGTAAAVLAAPLQRFWRDANVAALHASLDWDGVSAMYGQQQLGVEPVGVY